jgi:hypothetical protein
MYSSGADNLDFATGGVNRLKLDANGDFRFLNRTHTYTITRTLPVTVNDVVDIGSFSTGIFAGGSAYRFTIVHGDSGTVISRMYELPTQFPVAGSSGWRICPYK